MADDKAAGGGWDWGAVEIIIVVLLAIGLLDHVFGRDSLSKSTPASKAPVAQQHDGSTCGLSLLRPRFNEKVSTIVTIAGDTTGCDWRSTEDIALFAQIVDSKGKPVSEYTAIPPSTANEGTASFNATLALTAKPASGTGYLILVPAIQPSGTHSVSTRIPLKF